MSKLRESLIDELKDLLDAEKQLLKALPKMAAAAEHEELKTAFEEHETQTEEHVSRLEQVFGMFDEPVRGKKCKAMEGLVAEAKDLIDEEEGDAALIAGAQKAEHYEIASYGTLVAWAKALQETEAADLLQETLDEEKAADEKLTTLAEEVINREESEEEGEEGEEETSIAKKAPARSPKRK